MPVILCYFYPYSSIVIMLKYTLELPICEVQTNIVYIKVNDVTVVFITGYKNTNKILLTVTWLSYESSVARVTIVVLNE